MLEELAEVLKLKTSLKSRMMILPNFFFSFKTWQKTFVFHGVLLFAVIKMMTLSLKLQSKEKQNILLQKMMI